CPRQPRAGSASTRGRPRSTEGSYRTSPLVARRAGCRAAVTMRVSIRCHKTTYSCCCDTIMMNPTDKLVRFVELVERWNRSINLTAPTTRADLDEHVEDARQVVGLLRDATRVLDVGSGGGFPVVVAAVLLSETRFVALEPIHKKHAFLRTAARELE